MSDASDITRRRQQRVLFADRTVQKAAFDNGLKIHIVLQGGNYGGAMTYDPAYYGIAEGAIETTPQEQQNYINSVASPEPPATVPVAPTVPGAPTAVSATGGNGEASITFTPPVSNGGSAIISYTVTSSPGGFTASGASSPVIVPYLSNNTAYTFTVVATNSVGDSASSSDSNSITTTTPSSSAPTITGINPLTTSFIVTFTAPASFGTITNYEYSLDGGSTFTALSPTDAASPITIPSLTPTTTYGVAIRAINNVPEPGDSSNIVSIATATSQVTETFSTPISTTWTAPANIRYVQYLCVAGGGGGGAAYSKINVLGTVPVQSTAPASGYWIYNGVTNATYTNGRMYNGAAVNPNYTTFSDPIRCTTSADLQPTGTTLDRDKWFSTQELVYDLSSALPTVTNIGYPVFFPTSASNKISGGGGGGASGQVNGSFSATSFYSVVPRTTYTVIVGDGGDGGVGGPNSETAGTKGGNSTFDMTVCEGGSGGQPSRVLTSNTDGFGDGGRGQTTTRNQIGGYGGKGAGGNGGQGLSTTGGSGGAASGVGPNFPGGYCRGGNGGVPNTVATGVTTPNIGNGGSGTGATLNSYASGIKGGTGVVIIKYYV